MGFFSLPVQCIYDKRIPEKLSWLSKSHTTVSWRALAVRHGWEIHKLIYRWWVFFLFLFSCLLWQITVGCVTLPGLHLASSWWMNVNWGTWVRNMHLNPRLKRFKIRWPCKCDQINKKWHWKISFISAYFTGTAVFLLEAYVEEHSSSKSRRIGWYRFKEKSNYCNEVYQMLLISLKSSASVLL